MTKNDLNLLVGICAIIFVIIVEFYLFFKVKNNWSDHSRRGENIFYIIGMIFGLFGIIVSLLSFY